MRKPTILAQSEQLVNAGGALELFAANVNTMAGCRKALKFAKEMDKRLMRLYAATHSLIVRTDPPSRRKKQPGEGQQWFKYDTPYRCWACYHMGSLNCDNPFLNRKACSNFSFNRTLLKHPERIETMQKGNASQLDKLSLPVIKTFSEHIQKCKTCDKFTAKTQKNLLLKMSRHYQKYRSRRIIKVGQKMAYYGIVFRPNYILDWED